MCTAHVCLGQFNVAHSRAHTQTHASIPFEYLLSWWEFCDNHLNRTIKAKRKWALHFVFACICVYDLNIMSTSQDYSAETGKNMKILLPKWLLLTNISNFQMEWKWQFFFALSLSLVFISFNSAHCIFATTHQRCSLFCNKNAQLIYGHLILLRHYHENAKALLTSA